MPNIDWNLAANWAQAISNTVVLFLIYLQMRQVNLQMLQNDDQERFRRSWEFVKLYREEVRNSKVDLAPILESFDATIANPQDKPCATLFEEFFKPRVHLFVLLDQLIHHQQVDERVLFGYLEYDFNLFVELGVAWYGDSEFRRIIGSRINMLLTLWGSQIKASRLLYRSQTGGNPKRSEA